MKILITNDDGVDALGLRLLVEWAKKLGEVTVVAPKNGQSNKSHAIELSKSIEIKRVAYTQDVRAYAVDSTPADCVRFGILGLQEKYDLLFSGINKGVNVGDDIVYSGTVGAAFEGAKLGVRAVAFSAFDDGVAPSARHLDEAYGYLLKGDLLSKAVAYNINIPTSPKGIKLTRQGSSYYRDGFVRIEGDLYRQEGVIIPDAHPSDKDRDTVALLEGFITVMPLTVDRTDRSVFEEYKGK